MDHIELVVYKVRSQADNAPGFLVHSKRQESSINDMYFIYKQGNWDVMFPIFEFLSSYSPQTSNLLD